MKPEMTKSDAEELNEQELNEVLEAPVQLSKEATTRTEHFSELLEQTTNVGLEAWRIIK